MSIRDDFFAAQAKASLWDVAVSIKRGNPLPLDANSVFKAYGTVGGEDYAGSLLEYATSNPVAYPGQICAVVGVDATTIYYLDQDLAIQPVGIIPTGDGKSIDVAESGEISLHGFGDLTASHVGYLPRVKKVVDIAAAEGVEEVFHLEIEWAPVSAIVQGDGNSVTEISEGCPCIKVEDKAEEDFEGHKYEISLNLSAEEGNILEEKEDGLYANVDVPEYAVKANERADGATETTYHLTKDGVNVDVAIVVPDAYNDEALAGRVGALEGKVDTGDKKVSVYVAEQIANAEVGKLTKIIIDSVTAEGKVVIDGEETDPIEHIIYMLKVESATGDMYKEYMVIGGELVQTGDTSTDLSGYVTKTTKVNGQALESDIELKAEDIYYSKEQIEDDGSGSPGYITITVKEEIDSKMDADVTGSDIKLHEDIEDTLTGEMIVAPTIAEAVELKADKTTVASDIATAKQEAIDAAAAAEEAKGYAVASDVERDYAKKATTLTGYGITDAYTKNEVDNKIGTPGVPELKDSEGNTTQEAVDGTGIFASAYSKAEVNALLDAVSGGSSETAASVKRQLDEYKTSNNERVLNIENRVGQDVNGETPATGLFLEVDQARAQADTALNNAQAANQAVTQLANGQVATNKSNIENLRALVGAIGDDSADTLAGKIGALEAHDQAHTVEFNTLSGKVDQNTADIAKKANATDVYTKGEVDAKLVPLALAANVYSKTDADDKFLAKADYEAYDDTEVRGLITAEENRAKGEENKLQLAIDYIYKAGNEEAGTQDEGLLATAIDDIKQNTADIAKLVGTDQEKSVRTIAQEEIASQLATAPEAFDTLIEMAEWLGTHSTDAVNMDNRIKANEAKLAGFGGTDQPAVVKTYIDESIEAVRYTLPVATVEALGGIKSAADVNDEPVKNAVYVDGDGKASIKAISTDILVNGEAEFVLNGGNAVGATA